MLNRKASATLLMFGLIGSSVTLAAQTARPGGKSTAKVSAAKKKPGAGNSSQARTTARSKPRTPPRQLQPSPERYMQIQQALADRGYYEGLIDGVWGAACVDALKRFQTDQDLAPDGKIGALSLIALGLGPKREPLPPQFLAKPEPSN